MKNIIMTVLLIIGVNAQAEISCSYLSSKSQINRINNVAFLMNFSAEFNCAGKLISLSGDNKYVSCKPQFQLKKFVDTLAIGETVKLNLKMIKISDTEGSQRIVKMVDHAVSAGGNSLKPQTMIVRGKQVECKTTQIEVL